MLHTLIRQHLIDPEICIRCNTCEATCPVGAITHDARNYVVNVDICNNCQACVPPCPTGSIDNWRSVPKEQPYSVQAQLGWDELPAALEGLSEEVSPSNLPASTDFSSLADLAGHAPSNKKFGSTVAPHSAVQPVTNLHGIKNPIIAKVAGNYRVTALGTASDTHHIVLDFGAQAFPVLEGQSIGIIPSGLDASGKPHHPRQYSIASPRNGERSGYNNLSLTIKRVLEDYDGKPTVGVASNYVCDAKVGDEVQVTGPFGTSFLMPNHADSHLVMICTGTGSAPMRAMTEWRRRQRTAAKPSSGKLMLFFGARTKEELPYFGPLQNLPKDFIDIHFAFSRAHNPIGQGSKRYVQDVMREQAQSLAALLKDANSYFYVCGLQNMEAGVLAALKDIADAHGMDWSSLSEEMRTQGRLHLETY